MTFLYALRMLGRQAVRLRRQDRDILRLERAYRVAVDANARLAEENVCIRRDADLLALMLPPRSRPIALALVRDRRRIQRLDEARGHREWHTI